MQTLYKVQGWCGWEAFISEQDGTSLWKLYFASRNSKTVLLGSDFHLQIAGHILSLKALKSACLANVKSPLVSYAQLRSESVFLPASQPTLRLSVSQAALKGCTDTFLLRFLQPEEEAEGNVDLTSPSYK